MRHTDFLNFPKTSRVDTLLFVPESRMNFLETVVAVLFADRPFLVVNITIEHEGGR